MVSLFDDDQQSTQREITDNDSLFHGRAYEHIGRTSDGVTRVRVHGSPFTPRKVMRLIEHKIDAIYEDLESQSRSNQNDLETELDQQENTFIEDV